MDWNFSADVNDFINNQFKQLNSNTENKSEDEDNEDFNAKKSTEFQIVVDRKALENLIKTAGSEVKRKSKKFTGKWVQVFKQGINQYENNNNKLLGTIARVHESSVKKTASYIKGTIVCNEAKDCKCKYTVILKDKPAPSANSFIQINVIRENEHVHNVLNTQLRDEERLEAVEQCLLTSNWSAHAHVDKIISDKILAGEDLPDELELKSRLFKNLWEMPSVNTWTKKWHQLAGWQMLWM